MAAAALPGAPDVAFSAEFLAAEWPTATAAMKVVQVTPSKVNVITRLGQLALLASEPRRAWIGGLLDNLIVIRNHQRVDVQLCLPTGIMTSDLVSPCVYGFSKKS